MHSQRTYVHGYGPTERERLIHQARTLAPFLHRDLGLAAGGKVLEIGCGVGAQLQVLATGHPRTRFWGVDVADEHVAAARQHLRQQVASGQVSLTTGDGAALPFADGTFDAVVVFFVLEHVPEPLPVVREAHRVLMPSGTFFCTEVVNSTLIASPESQPLLDYWSAFNAWQRELGGDPDIGIRLGGLLHRAGFRQVALDDASVILDERTEDPAVRAAIVDNWIAVFLSAHDRLVAEGRVGAGDDQVVRREFTRYLDDQRSVFAYPARRARGRKTAETGARNRT